MSEYSKNLLIGILAAVVFIACVALVVGQRNIGPTGLLMMLAGLAGLLVLLGLYNRQYK